jgi:hypothetical protein
LQPIGPKYEKHSAKFMPGRGPFYFDTRAGVTSMKKVDVN